MIVSTDRKLTLDEYLDYDDGTDIRYELEDGVLVEMSPENQLNVRIASFLFAYFLGLGLPYYRLAIGHHIAVSSTKATARQPDFMVHSPGSDAAIAADGKVLRAEDDAPLLVVEVVSSSDTDRKSKKRDYVDKRDEYEKRGIPEYWLIDPIAGVVIVFTFVDRTYHSVEFRGAQPIVSPGFPTFGATAGQVLTAVF
jgi:Uma2 family endonuclease